MDSGEHWRLGRRPGLDGLRGVAILLVVAGHARALPGVAGPVGVTVFFALSGFLITSLLLDELDRRGRISLRAFYGRRAKRLLPVFAAYLGVGFVLTLLGVWVFPLVEYVPAALYIENWLMAIRGFAPDVLSISWSLAIEEQFYLLWPLLIVLLGRRWRLAGAIAVAGIVAAPLLRISMWDGGAGQWRIYYGTDTRMDCLLFGCLLAVLVKHFGTVRWLRSAGLVGVVLVALPFASGAVSVHLWLPTSVALGTSLVIGGVLSRGSTVLGWAPMRWLGARSYALYLWHYPIVYIAGRHGVLPMWLAIGLSLVAAEASWWLIERPVKRMVKRQTESKIAPIRRPPVPDEIGVIAGAVAGSAPAATPAAPNRVKVPPR